MCRPEVEALAALRILSSALGKLDLKRLNLSDNALGEKGLRACKDAFQNQVAILIPLYTDETCQEYCLLQEVGISVVFSSQLNFVSGWAATRRGADYKCVSMGRQAPRGWIVGGGGSLHLHSTQAHDWIMEKLI